MELMVSVINFIRMFRDISASLKFREGFGTLTLFTSVFITWSILKQHLIQLISFSSRT